MRCINLRLTYLLTYLLYSAELTSDSSLTYFNCNPAMHAVASESG